MFFNNTRIQWTATIVLLLKNTLSGLYQAAPTAWSVGIAVKEIARATDFGFRPLVSWAHIRNTYCRPFWSVPNSSPPWRVTVML